MPPVKFRLISDFPTQTTRAEMTTRTRPLPLAPGLVAPGLVAPGLVVCLMAGMAGCTTIAASDGNAPGQVVSTHAHRHGSAACFYSAPSGADRILGLRVLHWCGPEPKALF